MSDPEPEDEEATEEDFGDPYDDNPDGYDRNGALGADGQVYSDADPGL